jgi:hypothetical protein
MFIHRHELLYYVASPLAATRNGLARPRPQVHPGRPKELQLSRPSLSKTGNVPKITHKKCYRPIFSCSFTDIIDESCNKYNFQSKPVFPNRTLHI